jgi:N-acetylglutamate synthase-like GNAT family acetyltransferase
MHARPVARAHACARPQPARRAPARAAAASPPPPPLRFAPGAAEHRGAIFRAVLAEKLNPLFLKPQRYTVALDARNGAVVGFGQLRPLASGAFELATVVVVPERRGAGVGAALVEQLLERAGGSEVWLVTIGRRAAFYRRAGFAEAGSSPVPRALAFEAAIGALIARVFAGDSLVVMRRGGA